MSERRFYVYAHLRKDGTPFYVGKGKDKRAIDKTSRSDWWWNIVNADYTDTQLPNYVLLAEHLTEQEALDLEVQYIAKYGRKNVHPHGILINNTDGGEGTVGVILSEVTRKKMSLARKGKKNPMWGTTRPDSVKLAVSHANKGKTSIWKGKTRPDDSRLRMAIAHGSQPVSFVHLPSGIVVRDVVNKTEFSRQYNLNANHIRAIVRGERKMHKGWTLLTN